MTLIRGQNGSPDNVPIITCPFCGRNCDERIHGSDSLRVGQECDSDDCPSHECPCCGGQKFPSAAECNACYFQCTTDGITGSRHHYGAPVAPAEGSEGEGAGATTTGA